MSELDELNVPRMEVSQLLDKTTLVITGLGGKEVDTLRVGDRLQVLALGGQVQGLDAPLIVPKAEVEVTGNAGLYVIARSPEYEYEKTTAPLQSIQDALSGRRTTRGWRRDPLPVDEADLTGNPAAGPVKVGDLVVQSSQFEELVKAIAVARKNKSKK